MSLNIEHISKWLSYFNGQENFKSSCNWMPLLAFMWLITIDIYKSDLTLSVPELSWTLLPCMPFHTKAYPHKLQMQQSACLFFLSATLPFAVSCVWSPLSCWYLCLNWMRRSERVEVTRNGGFSQNLQTQHFNTSDRLRLSFYTLLLRSKTGLAVCNSFLESHQSTWSFLEIRDADFDACILYFNQAFIFMINVTKSFKK